MPQLLNERAALLLKKLVNSYISDGQPVGSKKLASDTELNISPATVRNVMSALEKKGLVKAPHTSAGRVPTEQGFRLFVDTLLEVQPIQKKQLKHLKKQLDPDQNTESLISNAGQMVSEMTHMAGIVTVPRPSEMKLRHIEFLALSDRRVLAILVINEKEVQNRVLHMEREYSGSELQHAASLLNQQFAGRDIFEVRESIMRDMQQTRADMDIIMKTAIEVAQKALTQPSRPQEEYVVQGKTNLVKYTDVTDTGRLQRLLEVFGHKREMLGLLDRCINAEGIKIFIGHEAGVVGLGDCCVVTAPYTINGKAVGALGVVGPTRINYDRVIPVVDVTARLLGDALNPDS